MNPFRSRQSNYDKIPKEIWDIKTTPSAFKLFIYLCTWGDKCFPPYTYIHKQTGFTDKTIRKAIKELVSLNMIQYQPGTARKGRGKANEYTLQDSSAWIFTRDREVKNESFTREMEVKKESFTGDREAVHYPQGSELSLPLGKYTNKEIPIINTKQVVADTACPTLGATGTDSLAADNTSIETSGLLKQINQLLDNTQLNPKDREFLIGLPAKLNRYSNLTPKQQQWLADILKKVGKQVASSIKSNTSDTTSYEDWLNALSDKADVVAEPEVADMPIPNPTEADCEDAYNAWLVKAGEVSAAKPVLSQWLYNQALQKFRNKPIELAQELSKYDLGEFEWNFAFYCRCEYQTKPELLKQINTVLQLPELTNFISELEMQHSKAS